MAASRACASLAGWVAGEGSLFGRHRGPAASEPQPPQSGTPCWPEPLPDAFWLMLLPCSATTWLFRALHSIHRGMESLQRGCWAALATPLHVPDSLLTHRDRALSTLLRHTPCHELLPWCSFAFRSLLTVRLRVYSMLAQHKAQTSANKPALGSCSATHCVISQITSKNAWNGRKSVLFWSKFSWTCKKPWCCTKTGHH